MHTTSSSYNQHVMWPRTRQQSVKSSRDRQPAHRQQPHSTPAPAHLCELGPDEAFTVCALCWAAGLNCIDLIPVPEHQHLPALHIKLLAHTWGSSNQSHTRAESAPGVFRPQPRTPATGSVESLTGRAAAWADRRGVQGMMTVSWQPQSLTLWQVLWPAHWHPVVTHGRCSGSLAQLHLLNYRSE
jgi:hypothetical protein